MPARSRPLVVALVAGLVAVLMSLPAAAQEAPPSPPGTVPPPPELVTPVFSARRVPDLLAADVADRRLRRQLDAVVAEGPETSCLVISDGSRVLYRDNGDVPLQPASTNKLLVGAAVLATLPPDRRLPTTVVAAEAPRDGVVEGDVWLVGGGDPLLTTPGYQQSFEDRDQTTTPFAQLADRLQQAGVREIRGSVLGDESRYDTERSIPSWPDRYVRQDTVGPLSALIVNDGVTGYSADPDQPTRFRQPGEPALLAAETLSSYLYERGIVVTGQAGTGQAPSGTVELTRIESPPLADVVGETESWSDNTTAELLAKELGREVKGRGSTAAGLEVVRESLERAGLPLAGLVQEDASGLGLENRLTCDLLVGLLDQAGPDSTLAQGLAVAGERGTLRRRMLGTGLEGRVHAKTGTLTNPPVLSLAGFLTTPGGATYSFADIQNGLGADASLHDAALGVVDTYPQRPDVDVLRPQPPAAATAR